MQLGTKIKIVAAAKVVFFLVGVWYWFNRTEKTFWGFVGYSILACLIGISVGTLITLPFKTEMPDEKPEEKKGAFDRLVDNFRDPYTEKWDKKIQDLKT